MTFNLNNRTRKIVGAVLATAIVGASATGAVVAGRDAPARAPNPTAQAATPALLTAPAGSTVPKPLMRAESAAEDVIGFLEQGKAAKSKAAARGLRELAHGAAADALRRAGAPESQIVTLQRRADRTARLALSQASPLRVALAANGVSQLMPAFYGRYQDPVPPAVLKLDYLGREVQLRSQGGEAARQRAAVREIAATWRALRPALVKAGGLDVARSYDANVRALKQDGSPRMVQREALTGLEIVDQMEGVFLGK